MKLIAIVCVVASSAPSLRGAAQDPPPAPPPPMTEPAQEQVAAATWRIDEPAPALEKCDWLQGATPPSSGKVVKKVGGDGSGGDMPLDPKDLERLAKRPDQPDIAALHGWVIVVYTFDSRDADMLASGLRMLKELATATEDRNVELVGLVASDDGEAAKRAHEYVGLTTPLGAIGGERVYFDPVFHGARAAFVIGRGGELAWKGDLVTDPKGFCAAMKIAVERHAAPALDTARTYGRELAPELHPALADYWAGRFAKARDAAKRLAAKLAKADTNAGVLTRDDAEALVAKVDEHERDLVQRCKQAAAAQHIETLVELESILELGFAKPVADMATDALKEIDAKTLHAGRTKDARDWRELESDRPLFFPARNDADGKKFARRIESFLKATPNSTQPTQRAKKLLERFQSLR